MTFDEVQARLALLQYIADRPITDDFDLRRYRALAWERLLTIHTTDHGTRIEIRLTKLGRESLAAHKALVDRMLHPPT